MKTKNTTTNINTIYPNKIWTKVLLITGIIFCTSSMYSSPVQAQSKIDQGINNDKILIAQTLGGIIRKIPISEVPLPAMSAAKTVTNAQFNQARIELQSEGSSIYVLRGKNQQGFEVEVQVSPSGTIMQVDEQIDPTSVPEIAVRSFKRWAPNDPLLSIWRSTRLGELYYQFVIEEFWLEVSTDGEKVIIYDRTKLTQSLGR
ncbi:MAG: hypothetical protein F6K62_26115 [Sphaerospermopsis sp. SIO1G2]|nr:hypothetical protein [Sphaerospermopsis sp. SIO1G1]NET74272.1 hypothetical protein [Sphaerospermopsis sp. SIO1G2]